MKKELERIALAAARRYKARCWWASLEDMEQEARLAIVEAQRTFDPTVGVPFGGYAWRAAILAVGEYVWRQSAPVSAPAGRLKELAGFYRAPLDLQLALPQDSADDRLDRARWSGRVRERIDTVLTKANAQFVRPILCQESKAAEVASQNGIKTGVIYEVCRRARRALEGDAEILKLWRRDE